MHLQSYNCALCEDVVEETVEHLFLHCDFARACWQLIVLTVPQSLGPFQILESFKAQLNVPFFMEVIIIMCWSIWAVRNNLIFRGQEATSQGCKHVFRNVFGLVILCAKKKYFPRISSWLDQIV
jgi:hypothetical protein